MLKDVADSKRINTNIAERKEKDQQRTGSVVEEVNIGNAETLKR